MPKSRIFAVPSLVRKMLAGLMSRWTMALAVRGIQAPADLNPDINENVRCDGARRISGQALLQCLSFEQLHRDERPALVLFDVIDSADIRMVEGRGGLGLALEALKGDRILGELFRQELQSGTATQLEIFGFVHHSHTTAAEDLQHSVLADFLPGQVAEQSGCFLESCRRHGWRYRFQPLDR